VLLQSGVSKGEENGSNLHQNDKGKNNFLHHPQFINGLQVGKIHNKATHNSLLVSSQTAKFSLVNRIDTVNK